MFIDVLDRVVQALNVKLHSHCSGLSKLCPQNNIKLQILFQYPISFYTRVSDLQRQFRPRCMGPTCCTGPHCSSSGKFKFPFEAPIAVLAKFQVSVKLRCQAC